MSFAFIPSPNAKIPRELNYESKKIQILGENGINAKLKHRKAHNLDFCKGDLVTCTGDWEIGDVSGRVGMYATDCSPFRSFVF